MLSHNFICWWLVKTEKIKIIFRYSNTRSLCGRCEARFSVSLFRNSAGILDVWQGSSGQADGKYASRFRAGFVCCCPQQSTIFGWKKAHFCPLVRGGVKNTSKKNLAFDKKVIKKILCGFIIFNYPWHNLNFWV